MRNGDFAVEVVARGKSVGVRETGSGHVLARPGQVYALRIRNFGPLRCVVEVRIDGRNVSAGGLVIEPWCTEELERPITPDEDGRFTVVAEGDERVFGPDGGRENPDLGLIAAHFRRELPGGPERARPLPPTLLDTLDRGPTLPLPAAPPRIRPEVSPIWNVSASAGMPNGSGGRGAPQWSPLAHHRTRTRWTTRSVQRAPASPATPSSASPRRNSGRSRSKRRWSSFAS
jgi:hypothetical protein